MTFLSVFLGVAVMSTLLAAYFGAVSVVIYLVTEGGAFGVAVGYFLGVVFLALAWTYSPPLWRLAFALVGTP